MPSPTHRSSAHLTACDRCRPLVDELSLLRGALAELPDLAPSRPLRLIPPVPAPAATPRAGLAAPSDRPGHGRRSRARPGRSDRHRGNGRRWRLFGQAASGILENLSAGGPASEATASDKPTARSRRQGIASADSNETEGLDRLRRRSRPATAQFSPAAAPSGSDGTEQAEPVSPSHEQPWLTLLIAGAAVFVTATALRFTISPRAG